EIAHVALTAAAGQLQTASGELTALGGVLRLIPKLQAGASGVGGTPHATVAFGGEELGEALKMGGEAFSILAGIASTSGSISATVGGYHRRQDEWQFQADQAAKEL